MAQAERTAQALAAEPVAAIYTSPMLRARQTARVLASRHPEAPVRVSRLLHEIRTPWQGVRWAEIGHDANLFDPRPGHVGDGESMADVADRMERCLRRVVRRHAGHAVVCVSHGDPILIAKARLLGKELTLSSIREGPYPERASVTRFRFLPDGELEVSYESPAQALITD
jgi:broad specificity phosphatase PhoE